MSPVPPVIHRAQVGSTLDLLHRLAQEGAQAGTAVLADEQLQGRGARGHQWHSPVGGLWLSVLYRPAGPVVPEVLSLRLALTVVRALEVAAGPGPVAIKWPNDLLLDGRKLGGVLCELRWHGSTLAWIAAGVGINVANPLPPEVRAGAARLVDHHPEITPARLAAPLIEALRRLPLGRPALTDDEIAEWDRRDWLRGRRLAEPVSGIAIGVGRDGTLRVRGTGGSVIAARSGHVVLAGT